MLSALEVQMNASANWTEGTVRQVVLYEAQQCG